MRYLPYILLVFLFINGLIGCSSNVVESANTPKVQEIVVFDDGYATNEDGDLIFDDQDIKGRTLNLTQEHSEESTKKGRDGSTIKIMNDGYGNKTITRFFDNHPLIAGIVSRISARGVNKTLVYTNDGLVKTISDNLGNLINSASANEIAKKAEIYSLDSTVGYKPKLQTETEQIDDSSTLQKVENAYDYLPTTLEQPKAKDDETVSQRLVPKVPNTTETVSENTFMDEFDTRAQLKSQISKKKPQNKK